MSNIKELDDQCNVSDEYTTEIIDTTRFKKLRESINFKNEEKQIRHHRIRAENVFEKKRFCVHDKYNKGISKKKKK